MNVLLLIVFPPFLMLYVSFKKLFSNSSVFNTLDCIVDSLVLTAGSSRSTSVCSRNQVPVY